MALFDRATTPGRSPSGWRLSRRRCSHCSLAQRYARSLWDRLAVAGFWVELDERFEKIAYKIREAHAEYSRHAGDGDREAAESTVVVPADRGAISARSPLTRS